MFQNILLFLLFFLFPLPSKSANFIEEIEEFVPKIITSDGKYYFYKIFKYHIPYNENFKKTSINIQIDFINDLNIYIYDNLTIVENEAEYFNNYMDIIKITNKQHFYSTKKLNCDNDYYLVFEYFDYQHYHLDYDIKFCYFQIVIINEETNIINISPLLSDYFEIIPRNIYKNETFFIILMKQNMPLFNLLGGN